MAKSKYGLVGAIGRTVKKDASKRLKEYRRKQKTGGSTKKSTGSTSKATGRTKTAARSAPKPAADSKGFNLPNTPAELRRIMQTEKDTSRRNAAARKYRRVYRGK